MSIKREVLEAAEDRVAAGEASSVSAWVEDAMEKKANDDELLALLAEMDAEFGPPSEEAEAWARNVLGY